MTLKKNLDILLFEKLNEEIIKGKWASGQQLSADEFAERYGVSRTPAVQALKRMNALGMVSVMTTGHFYVPSFTEQQVYDLLEMRALLERQAIIDIEQRNVRVDTTTLRKLAEECSAYNEAADLTRTRQADLRLHSFLISQSHNGCLSEMYAKIQGQFMVANYVLTTHTKDQQRVAAEEHELIINALEEKDFERAKAICDEHIYEAREKILIKMKASNESI